MNQKNIISFNLSENSVLYNFLTVFRRNCCQLFLKTSFSNFKFWKFHKFHVEYILCKTAGWFVPNVLTLNGGTTNTIMINYPV